MELIEKYKDEEIKGKILELMERLHTDVDKLLIFMEKNKENEKLVEEKIRDMDSYILNKCNNLGYTTLIWACQKKIKRVALKLLEREDINVNQVDNLGYTALIWACQDNMETVALKLLEREDINVNQVGNFGKTALYYAIGQNMKSVINRINELNKK